jgi:hypothetical protein
MCASATKLAGGGTTCTHVEVRVADGHVLGEGHLGATNTKGADVFLRECGMAWTNHSRFFLPCLSTCSSPAAAASSARGSSRYVEQRSGVVASRAPCSGADRNPPALQNPFVVVLSRAHNFSPADYRARPLPTLPASQRLLDDGDKVTVFDVELFTKRWEMLMTPEEIAKVSEREREPPLPPLALPLSPLLLSSTLRPPPYPTRRSPSSRARSTPPSSSPPSPRPSPTL